jgi:hypothetical protein
MCDWRLEGSGVYIDRFLAPGSEEDGEELEAEAVGFLIGSKLEGVTSGIDLIDPVFHLLGGVDLIVHADTAIDPWALTLPMITIIGQISS